MKSGHDYATDALYTSIPYMQIFYIVHNCLILNESMRRVYLWGGGGSNLSLSKRSPNNVNINTNINFNTNTVIYYVNIKLQVNIIKRYIDDFKTRA